MARDSSSALSSVLAGGADTIVARATAPGRGALAIVRLSGPETARIAGRVCTGFESWPEGWRSQLVRITEDSGVALEEAVATAFPAPRSFTGEDMLELTIHASPWLVEQVVKRCVEAGARPAAPGEFTRRAVANGKMDLVQAEGIRDLIAAETAWQARNARLQLDGVLSRRIGGLRRTLVEVLAEVEGALDFSDQEVVLDRTRVEAALEGCRAEIAALAATGGVGVRLREGFRVVIAGRPNAGKSTLFNHLLGRSRTIVAATPGTTRDVVEAMTEIDGLPVVLTDTAGLRTSGDVVEDEGVQRAREALGEADAVILVWAADDESAAPVIEIAGRLLRVRTKCDLGVETRKGWLEVSVHNGDGTAALRRSLGRAAMQGMSEGGNQVMVAARHRTALEEAATALQSAPLGEPELAAEQVRGALRALDQILGPVDHEEILDQVFSSFCLGK